MIYHLISLPLTILIYYVSKGLYKKRSLVIFSPLIVVPTVLIMLINANLVSYTTYAGGTEWLTKLLGPATVAMAVPLHKNFKMLKQYALEITVSIFIGSASAIISSMMFSSLLRLNHETIVSIAPRSVTTPIAIGISKVIGGVQSLTAVFVILTGLVGIVVGPIIIKVFRIRSSIAKGIMLGLGAHGCGISKAIEFGTKEMTIASLAMIVAAGFTLALIPLIVPIMERLL